MKVKVILVLALIALLAVLCLQNTEVVTYRLFFWTVSLSQMILVPFVAALGFLAGYIVGTAAKGRKGG